MYITGLELLLPSCSTVVLVVVGGGRGGIAGALSEEVGRGAGGREAFSTDACLIPADGAGCDDSILYSLSGNLVLVASGTVAGD